MHGLQCAGLDPSDGHSSWYWNPNPNSIPWAQITGWWLLGIGAEYLYFLSMEPLHPPQLAAQGPYAGWRAYCVTNVHSARDGNLQWFLHHETALEPAWDGASSLVEADGVVYTYGRGLHAVEAAIHHPRRWTQANLPENPMGGMLAVGHATVVVTNERFLGAFRQDTGAPMWAETSAQWEAKQYEWYAGVLALGETVYVGRVRERAGGSLPRVSLEARTEATGAVRWAWTEDSTLLHHHDGWRFRGAGNTLYIPSRNHVWGLRATDGTLLWHRELPVAGEAFLAISAVNA